MAEFETLAVLISLRVWAPLAVDNPMGFAIMGDNTAALTATYYLKSPSPLVNALAAEISLTLERFRTDIRTVDHLASVLNTEADALSRLWEGASVPTCLRGIRPATVPVRDDAFWAAWLANWSHEDTS